MCAPNGRMADWLGNHQAGKGVHTVDTLDGVDERGSVKVDTPGGAQQMTVRHVPEEWREVGSVPTPGGTTLVTTDVPPSPRNFAPGYPRRIFGPGPPLILRAAPSCEPSSLPGDHRAGIFFADREAETGESRAGNFSRR